MFKKLIELILQTKNADIILGSYDKKKDEYNLSYSTGTSDDFDNITVDPITNTGFFTSPLNNQLFGKMLGVGSDVEYTYNGQNYIQYEKILILANQEILNDKKYRVSFELLPFNGVLQGDLNVRLFNNTDTVNEYYQVNGQTYPVFQGLSLSDVGVYEYIVEPNSFNTTTGSYTSYENTLFFEGQFANGPNGNVSPLLPFIGSIKNPKIEIVESVIAYTNENFKTITFKENVKGWPSHKSFTPESGVSCSGDYYTFNNGKIYVHHDESQPRNTFYGNYVDSSIDLLLNDAPSISKNFVAINYEGSQSKVMQNEDTSIDKSYYNLTEKPGWYLDTLQTDKEKGQIRSFVEKEGFKLRL